MQRVFYISRMGRLSRRRLVFLYEKKELETKAEIIVEHDKGYFNASIGTTELPVARDALLKIAQ